MSTLKKTPLTEDHISLGAKMGPFAGFEMPLQYSSAKEEVLAVRNKAGVFDVSHMGEFFVTGPQAVDFVDYMLTNDFYNLPEKRAQYSPLCREDGTIIDDLIAYKLSRDRVLICVNASNIEKDWEAFKSEASKFQCELTNHSEHYALIALQGPASDEILEKMKLQSFIDAPPFFVDEINWMGKTLIIAKTGYTGEKGIEIFCPLDSATLLWRDLLALGVIPCGLVARDILRTEAALVLYGQDITDALTPLDSGLKWTVKDNGRNFRGKEKLLNATPRHQWVKLILKEAGPKAIPRPGQDIVVEDSESPGTWQKIGTVSSGTYSVTREHGIALGHIKGEISIEGKELFIMIRGRPFAVEKVKKNFL